MRNFVKLAVLIVAIGVTPVMAEEVSTALVHPGADGVTPPEVKMKSRVDPYYPATARASRAHGTVVVSAAVLRDGSVGELNVVACDNPNQGFEQSSLDAIKKWRFSPAMQEGEAVDSYTMVQLRFSPPSGRMGGGAVAVNTYHGGALPGGLPGSTGPIRPPDGTSLSVLGDGRAYPEVFIRPPCGPESGRCLYDRNALLREALEKRGEPGMNRPRGRSTTVERPRPRAIRSGN